MRFHGLFYEKKRAGRYDVCISGNSLKSCRHILHVFLFSVTIVRLSRNLPVQWKIPGRREKSSAGRQGGD